MGEYHNKVVKFTLYKCSLSTGGYQWFISITPDEIEPGSKNDIDFYCGVAKPNDKLPPVIFSKVHNNPNTKDPPPKIIQIRNERVLNDIPSSIGINADSSDSDRDSTVMICDGVNDDSFVSNGSDQREYYD